MKVLLVWEEIGADEPFNLYLLTKLTDEDLVLLNKANGKIINVDDDAEAASKVWDYITDDHENAVDPLDPDNGKWKDMALDIMYDKPVINESINRVYVCGALV